MNQLIYDGDRPDRTRRLLLFGLVSAYTATLIPWALAQEASDADEGAFLALSAILVGRQSLDAAQAQRLYAALVADDPGFPAAAKALLALIEERKIDPMQLQTILDDEKSALIALPRRIVTAWYMGIVGEGFNARALAFEKALNAEVVGDVLRPPTYSYGAYGSWARKPI
ncbi:sorbitol dehydrogenase family protein [Falsochrobactrum sp. TDYN1]|uniref:Sorbitol dehydrogenase family protein n=1 Tax=Falsochrobactrum tianjinense TaxID=2706015 RepID=A0A949PQL9_9HYPH|nr:sorbitol dehydrogenase family protein [Falsochrobactrum sp. TDYN1]MBV2144889.1 sorbitol dehydrogenase family protein [Falsochrobactrum sp. TDYN1]